MLNQLEWLVISGRLGHDGGVYIEIAIKDIRKADRLCKRTRAAIGKATGAQQ